MLVKLWAFALFLGMATPQALPQTSDSIQRPPPDSTPLSRPWGLNPLIFSNPWIPPWVSQWLPQWVLCDPDTIGPSCQDCNTRIICTRKGGLLRRCTDPNQPYCAFGQCSAVPSARCGHGPRVPSQSGGQELPASQGSEEVQVVEVPVTSQGSEQVQVATLPNSQVGEQVQVAALPDSQGASQTVQVVEVPPLQPEPY